MALAAVGPSTSSAPASPRSRKLGPGQVQELLDAAKTPRMRELAGLQAFFDGSAYDGRANFFNNDVPMQERKPCIVYPIVTIAAESNVAFAMGEGRFPTILSLTNEDDSAFDDDLGFSQDESAIVDSFNTKLIKLARLERVFRQAYRMSMAARSVAFVLGYRAGLPFADLVWAKLCTPTFGDPVDPTRCTRLEIRYRYTDQWRDPVLTGGEWWTRVFEYLRVIDDNADTVYKPVGVWDPTDPGAIEGGPVQTKTLHGFGFCPVHWYARNLESVVGNNYDGKAIHDGSCALVEQLDYALSQRHRAAIYAGDPQTVLTGLSDDDWANLGQMGRPVAPLQLPGDQTKNGAQWQAGFNGPQPGQGRALKRGVMNPWRITDPQGNAVVMALPGDALTALDVDAKDIGSKACDALGITIIDPSAFSGGGDLSGRTLAFLFSKQINRVSQDREDLGRCCMLPVLNLFYRMLIANSSGVYLPGLKKALPILSRFYKPLSGDSSAKIWFCPQLELKWGDYFEPSDVDESTRAATAISAYTAKIITLKSAVEHVRAVFGISSVDQYVTGLTDEVAQRQQDAVDQQLAMNPQPPAAGPSGKAPGAQQSPNAAPPASGTPKAKRNAKPGKKAAA